MLHFSHGQDACQPIGWATQNGGVTGGGNDIPVVVSNYNDFKKAIGSATSKVIHINGTILIPPGGRITLQNIIGKTIIGLPGSKLTSEDLSKDGSGILYVKNSSNVIFRNLIFIGPGAYDADGYDNLCIDNCLNFWIDHCEFHDGMDGNFDVKNKSDFISVTWCTFSYEKPPISGGSGGSDDHRYSNLIGSSDGATDDEGKLNITFQYCWWGEGCKERMPRMRFGKLHMVNNLFTSSVSNSCIRAGYKADVLAEGNYFDNQKLGIDLYNNDFTAVKAVNNYGASDIIKNNAFIPPYSLIVAASATVVTPIKTCAGAKLNGPLLSSPCCINTGLKDDVENKHTILVTPNPFRDDTDISYTIAEESRVQLQIVNSYGQVVYERNYNKLMPGQYQFNWNGKVDFNKDAPSGIYFLRVTNGKIISTSRIIKTN